MIIDPTDVLELVFTSSKRALKENHAKLVAAVPEFEALEEGHHLTSSRRGALVIALEAWDDERIWFTVDNRGGVSLQTVCDAAGTEVSIVRAFYQDFLILPFNFKKAYSNLIWEENVVREDGRRCPSGRCEVPQARVHDEGGTLREGLAGSDRLRAGWTSSVHRTEAPGRGERGS